MFNVLLFIFKIRNQMLPKYICEKVKLFNQRDFILLVRCSTSQLLNSVLYKGLYDFNQLPNTIEHCDNLSMFKNLLKEYVMSHF